MRLKDEIEASTGLLKLLEAEIKQVGKTIFIKEYKDKKMKPENFRLKDETGASCMFICMDKYTVVDEAKAEVLKNIPDILEEKETYKINPELVEKYATVLSELIMSSKKITEEDKVNLIQGELQYTVKKGSVERLMQYDNLEEVFSLINPIVSLKK